MIIGQLASVKNALEALRLLGLVEKLCTDSRYKPAEKVNISLEEVQTLIANLHTLANALDTPIYTAANGDLFILDENGLSIFYFQKDQRILSSVLSRDGLLKLLLTTGEFGLVDYFKTLVGLPDYSSEDLQAAEELHSTRQLNREIIKTIMDISVVAYDPTTPNLESARVVEVIQGSGNGEFVTSDEVDFVGTKGMSSCVALLIWQDSGEWQQAICVHIDDFSGRASLGGLGAAEFLDSHLYRFDLSKPLSIHLFGGSASMSSQKTILEIYKYLQSRGLEEQIVSANVLGKGVSDSVVLELKTGKVYPGVKLQQV